MVPKQYLTGFTPTVRVSGDASLHSGVTYIVDYEIGECVYTYQRIGKRIKQDVLQLIKCDMWKVITLIDEVNKLDESDYRDINMEIRNHSLDALTKFMSGQGHNQ